MEVKKGIKFFGKLPGLLKKLNLTITLILTAATLFSYSSVWLSPSEYTIIPALAGMAFPYILVVDVLYTLLLVFSKKWTALLMVAVLAAGYKMTDLTVRLIRSTMLTIIQKRILRSVLCRSTSDCWTVTTGLTARAAQETKFLSS